MSHTLTIKYNLENKTYTKNDIRKILKSTELRLNGVVNVVSHSYQFITIDKNDDIKELFKLSFLEHIVFLKVDFYRKTREIPNTILLGHEEMNLLTFECPSYLSGFDKIFGMKIIEVDDNSYITILRKVDNEKETGV